MNQTNGVTPRRWLLSSNPRLSDLIDRTIGEGWVDDLERLSELEAHVEDTSFTEDFAEVKAANKRDLADWVNDTLTCRLTRRQCSTSRSNASTNTSANT